MTNPAMTALAGTVRTVGPPISIARAGTSEPTADLEIVLTGGAQGSPVILRVAIEYNMELAAQHTPVLSDAANPAASVRATTSSRSTVFSGIQTSEPGAGVARIFRITNTRINGTQISYAPPSTGPISAMVQLQREDPTPAAIPLAGATQTVAILHP